MRPRFCFPYVFIIVYNLLSQRILENSFICVKDSCKFVFYLHVTFPVVMTQPDTMSTEITISSYDLQVLSGISAWREGIGFFCHLCWSLWCYLIWNLSLIGKVACLQNYLILSSSFLGFLCPEAVYFLNSSSLFLFKTLVRNAAAAAKSLQSWSDSVRPHRRQPTRLPCPWDSPGKNTGVGCHFLLH